MFFSLEYVNFSLLHCRMLIGDNGQETELSIADYLDILWMCVTVRGRPTMTQVLPAELRMTRAVLARCGMIWRCVLHGKTQPGMACRKYRGSLQSRPAGLAPIMA